MPMRAIKLGGKRDADGELRQDTWGRVLLSPACDSAEIHELEILLYQYITWISSCI
jgi:hypothetical protein